MEYCFSTDSPNSTGSSSSSSVAPKIRKKKKSGNSRRVKLSTDPQSVAARERRHRISDRFKILQSLVPGGSKMDTVSMLEEAIHYVKFLKAQIWLFHQNTTMNVSDHHHHHHHEPSSFLPGTPLVPSHQEGFYSSNSTNLTTAAAAEEAPVLLQPSALPIQLPPCLSPPPPPPQDFQDFDRFQGHDQNTMSLDEYYIKY